MQKVIFLKFSVSRPHLHRPRRPLFRSTSAMAPSKKTKSPSTGMKRVKGENFYRDSKAAARVKMLNGGKPVRDRDGKIIQAAAFQKTEAETKPGRVQPDRRWFGMCFSGHSFVDLSDLTVKEILGLFRRRHWNIFVIRWLPARTIHTLSS